MSETNEVLMNEEGYNLRQTIIVRKDLKMRVGKAVSQGAHSSMMFLVKRIQQPGFEYEKDFSEEEKAWMENLFTKICLQVNSEEELMDVYDKAVEAGLTVHLVTDSGKTEFHGVPTRTIVCIGPHHADRIDPITKDLRLY